MDIKSNDAQLIVGLLNFFMLFVYKKCYIYATARIKRLLEILSTYSFNLYYMKGKDMILSDFLSRQEIDRSDPHEIIPISFDMKAILNEKYYK